MARNGSGVYSAPAGTLATPGTTIESAKFNAFVNDVAADLNIARPIVAGGTGASNAADALVNLGLTATAAEINILDGATLTVTELNYVDGVTSAIQTQLDAKAPLASPTLTGTPVAPTASVGTNTTQIATTAFVRGELLDEDNMATNSATRPPSQQSVKAYVDAEIADVGWSTPVVTATTSGTGFVVDEIPADVTQIEIMFDKVSLDGTDDLLIQIGDSGGVETTGYEAFSTRVATANTSSTAGFPFTLGAAAISAIGVMTLSHMGGNKWVSSHAGFTFGTDRGSVGGGVKTLSGTLDRVQLTRTGTNNFDLGAFAVRWRQ